MTINHAELDAPAGIIRQMLDRVDAASSVRTDIRDKAPESPSAVPTSIRQKGVTRAPD